MSEIVIVLGNSGAGKSTQCERLAKTGFLNQPVRHFSIGNHLRGIRQGKIDSAFSGDLANLDAPSPPPNEIMNGIIAEALDNFDAEGITLIENYPRYSSTVEDFYATTQASDHHLSGIIHFDITRSTSIARVQSRGTRGDEQHWTDDTISHKYDRDRITTGMAILSILALNETEDASTKWEVIDANGTPDQVESQFIQALSKVALVGRP